MPRIAIPTRAWLALALGLSLAGACVSWVLASGHIAARTGGVVEGLFCGASGRFGCQDVALHESSSWLGVPLATWGLVYYAWLACLSLAALVHAGSERLTAILAAAALSAIAVLADVYLGTVMVTEIGSVCLNCVATYALNLALAVIFASLLLASQRPLEFASLFPSRAALRSGAEPEYSKSLFHALTLGLAVTSTAALASWTLLPLREIDAFGQRVVSEFLDDVRRGAAKLDMSRFDGQPSEGPERARIDVVLIGDFECSLCRSTAHTMDALRRESPGDIRVRFVNLPLCTDCNAYLPHALNVHPDACWLAGAGEHAALHGRFWEYHRLVFETMGAAAVSRDSVLARVAEIGLDRGALLADLDTGAPRAAVEADVELCRELGITTSPSLVINGHVKQGTLYPWMLRAIVEGLLEPELDHLDRAASVAREPSARDAGAVHAAGKSEL